MNRFRAAGLRSLKLEMMRKGAAEHFYGQVEVPDGAATGDAFAGLHYVYVLDEDRRDDGTAVCHIRLDPLAAALMGEKPPGDFHHADTAVSVQSHLNDNAEG